MSDVDLSALNGDFKQALDRSVEIIHFQKLSVSRQNQGPRP